MQPCIGRFSRFCQPVRGDRTPKNEKSHPNPHIIMKKKLNEEMLVYNDRDASLGFSFLSFLLLLLLLVLRLLLSIFFILLGVELA